jgi:hypothetical protein
MRLKLTATALLAAALVLPGLAAAREDATSGDQNITGQKSANQPSSGQQGGQAMGDKMGGAKNVGPKVGRIEHGRSYGYVHPGHWRYYGWRRTGGPHCWRPKPHGRWICPR